MSKQKTAYPEEWKKGFNWLTRCKESISKASSTIQSWSFKIDNSELAQVRAHAGTDDHKDKVKVISYTAFQKVIVTSNENKISLGSNKNILLSIDYQIICAKILQDLDCVQFNYSFTSANNEK